MYLSPNLEAAVSRDVDIGHWHPREEDREDSLLAPEYGGTGSPGGQAAQPQLLPRQHLGSKLDDWQTLRGMFYLSFFPIGKVVAINMILEAPG